MLSSGRVGRCPKCGEAVERGTDYYEITHHGDDDAPMGTSVYYHRDCAPFGGTTVDADLDSARRSRARGREMRRELAEGPDAE